MIRVIGNGQWTAESTAREYNKFGGAIAYTTPEQLRGLMFPFSDVVFTEDFRKHKRFDEMMLELMRIVTAMEKRLQKEHENTIERLEEALDEASRDQADEYVSQHGPFPVLTTYGHSVLPLVDAGGLQADQVVGVLPPEYDESHAGCRLILKDSHRQLLSPLSMKDAMRAIWGDFE